MNTISLPKLLCTRCHRGARGANGHEQLAFHMSGPYPGHNIFLCGDCGDRWIRHYGDDQGFGWTRYASQFAGAIRVPRPSHAVNA